MIYSTIISPFLRYLHPIHHSHIFLNECLVQYIFGGVPQMSTFMVTFFFPLVISSIKITLLTSYGRLPSSYSLASPSPVLGTDP